MAIPLVELLFRDANDDVLPSGEYRHGSPHPTPSDAELVDRLRQGDRSAEAPLFLSQYAPLVRYARRFTSSLDEAEDTVQEALVQFLERYRVGDTAALLEELPRSLPALLRTIVRRQVLDRWKHERRVHRIHNAASAVEVSLGVATPVPLPDVAVEHAEIAAAIRHAFRALSPRVRLVATMHWSDGLGRQAIAVELKVSVRTIDAQLYQAADRLRRALEPFR